MGQVPARFGFDGRYATSWADGSRGWRGTLPPGQVPAVINPGHGRIWTANARVIGGDAYGKLGDGGYDTGSRAGRIRDLLFARHRFAPADFLAIQLDEQNNRNAFWQPVLLAELRKRRADPVLAAMIAPVERWGGRAAPESVGYRLVSEFRGLWSRKAHEAYLGGKPDDRPSYVRAPGEGGMRALARVRPAALVPPGHRDWDAFVTAVLKELVEKVDGDLEGFTWGALNQANVRHPLSSAIPGSAG
jgi:penicillin amidase